MTLVAQGLKVTIREARKKRSAVRANKPTPADSTLERVGLLMKFLTCIETQLISTWLHVTEIVLSKSNFSGHKH